MIQNLFPLREEEIFKTLRELKNYDFVVIGGYAVNAYTLPRFSVDCDIVISDENELKKIEKTLQKISYTKKHPPTGVLYSGSFSRHEKELDHHFIVSMDILIGKVLDRITGSVFTADWVFKHSRMRVLKGKTITEALKLRIIHLDALLVMKIISCRPTDIRDVFMMLPYAKDEKWIKNEVSLQYNLKDRIAKIQEKVSSKSFKDGLAGVYGYFDPQTFEKHKKAVMGFLG
ncbi:MAG TPA: hypothetical protein VJG90_07290 [Candidatus Nanoarchaeia archaeon]|nr:hypothetical protein [Candidatus Nanoarchaeia archaeon]